MGYNHVWFPEVSEDGIFRGLGFFQPRHAHPKSNLGPGAWRLVPSWGPAWWGLWSTLIGWKNTKPKKRPFFIKFKNGKFNLNLFLQLIRAHSLPESTCFQLRTQRWVVSWFTHKTNTLPSPKNILLRDMCDHFVIHFPTEEQHEEQFENNIRHINKAIAAQKVALFWYKMN